MPGPRSVRTDAPSRAPSTLGGPRAADAWVLPARPRVGLLVKKSLYRVFIDEKKDERMHELLLRGDATVERLQSAHEAHEATIDEVRRALDATGATLIDLGGDRTDPLTTRDVDLLVSIGGDGTLLRASH